MFWDYLYWLIFISAILIMGFAAYMFGRWSMKKELARVRWNELEETKSSWWSSWLQGMSNEMFGALITAFLLVGIVSFYQQRRDIYEEKNSLILQMRSPNIDFAIEAVRLLDDRGWLYDGTLEGAILWNANLEGSVLSNADLRGTHLENANLISAELWYTDLRGANLYGADLGGAKLIGAELEDAVLYGVNLEGVEIDEWKLEDVSMLRLAIMPDGSKYDGRYRLSGDLSDARRTGMDVENPDQMSRFYDVSLTEYLLGQEWADEYLPYTSI